MTSEWFICNWFIRTFVQLELVVVWEWWRVEVCLWQWKSHYYQALSLFWYFVVCVREKMKRKKKSLFVRHWEWGVRTWALQSCEWICVVCFVVGRVFFSFYSLSLLGYLLLNLNDLSYILLELVLRVRQNTLSASPFIM